MDANAARQRSRTYTALAAAFSGTEQGLEKEYTRLFLGPGRPVAHPYESVYREGRTMGVTTLDVRRRLANEGLAPGNQVLADHVSIELAFMAHLAAGEALARDAGDLDGAQHWLEEQDSFLSDHLCAWLPQFCHRILAGRPVTHYAELARRAEAFVTSDATRVREWLGADTPETSVTLAGKGRWAVDVGEGCTLCLICVGVCQPGALQGARDEERGDVSLVLHSDRCDGCAACERWCPELSISVSRVLDSEPNIQEELARSPLLACPGCGILHVTQALVDRIQIQLGHPNQALAQRLLLCADCKSGDVPGGHRGAAQLGVRGSSVRVFPSLGRST